MPQNRHQRVTSTVTRLLVRQARRLTIPTTANQAAKTQLASYSLVPRPIACLGMRLAWASYAWEAREIMWVRTVRVVHSLVPRLTSAREG